MKKEIKVKENVVQTLKKKDERNKEL